MRTGSLRTPYGRSLPNSESPDQISTMKAYLNANGKLADALWAILAELGKSGSNLNQIAYMLNANAAPARIMNIIEGAAEEHRVLAAKCKDALDDMDELRTIGMQLSGSERS